MTESMTRTDAAALLDCPEEVLNPFAVSDTFNGGWMLEGFISRQSDHRYGAMVLFRVNDQDVSPQIIYGTPKLHYPFGHSEDGSERRYHFPKAVQAVAVYAKIDGTNVCAYSYADAEGKRYITYKTRLTPVLGDSRFGPFRQMWQELLDGDPELDRVVKDYVLTGKLSLSFEMYGYRNRHLIIYPESLATKLLFCVDQTQAKVHPPSFILDDDNPVALPPVARLTSGDAIVAFYEEKRAEGDALNKKVIDGDDELIEGTEGFIFYIQDMDNLWTQWKCKPSSVEDIHWVSDTIPLTRILPTVWNSLESDPEPTVEGVKQLLLEEFTAAQVQSSHTRIEKAVAKVLARLRWRERVSREYTATGLTFERDGKGPVMRALSTKFERGEMKLVFSALKEMGLTP